MPAPASHHPSRITLVAHTHWDREWYEPFEVFRAHLVEMLDEALDHLERDPRLSFTLDGHVALVDDYLELRPGAEPRIAKLVSAGRLHVGPWYTQADTLLTDGEALIRNLAAGIARGDQLGGAMRLGYMPDQFGHAAQMPQLLRLFGIDGAVLWRGVGPERPPHAFRWLAPDGSAVTALWLQDGYGSGRRLPSDPQGFADAVERMLDRLGDWLGEMPILVPVGDDHVKIPEWLPEAASALRARRPDADVAVGGYHQHLPHVGAVDHVVRGELRSPAFAPVLAGVASARIREKQAAARATTLLLRYAEPLAALVAQAGGTPPHGLIERAWRQLLLNHAHDSVAGCGIDAAHDDVKARYRWAEQLADAAIARSLGQLRLEAPVPEGAAQVIAFHPGPAAPQATIETHVPRHLEGTLSAVGPDGIARPVQPLGALDERPLFEGEFSAAELGQYLGGIDPATPLFGRFLTGITARVEESGLVRLDVGLGESPVPPAALVEDQRRITALLASATRFKVVLHGAGTTRPVLVQGGPAPCASLVPIVVRKGEPHPDAPRARRLSDDRVGITTGPITVTADPDGTVLIEDARTPLLKVHANDLVDEGDRGDLYHFDLAGAEVRAHAARARVTEEGPVRARLVIEQELALPLALSADRSARSNVTLPTIATTEITLTAGEPHVEFVTTFDNRVGDHRLRALFHVPLHAERLDVHHGLAVVARPLDPASALGAGTERAAPTGQHHRFVDLTDGNVGVALFSRGLPEHEVLREDGERSTRLALTLLRAVGWLSRGDLSVIDHAAGPMVPTPGAQEPGPHRFEYALLLHPGDWQKGRVLPCAERYAAPDRAVVLKGKHAVAPEPLVTVGPDQVVLSALHPSRAPEGGVVVRLLNASPEPAEARLCTSFPLARAIEIDPLEEPLAAQTLVREGRSLRLPLRPWQLATILLRADQET